MRLNKFISPSIMVPKIYEYEEYMKQFEQYKLSVIHFDVMDGHFVPNIMLGTSVFSDLKEMTEIPIDIHLMVPCLRQERMTGLVSIQKRRINPIDCFKQSKIWVVEPA